MILKEQKKWASPALPPWHAASPVDGLGSLLLRKPGFAKATGQLLGPLGNQDKSGYAAGLKGLETLFPKESTHCYK